MIFSAPFIVLPIILSLCSAKSHPCYNSRTLQIEAQRDRLRYLI